MLLISRGYDSEESMKLSYSFGFWSRILWYQEEDLGFSINIITVKPTKLGLILTKKKHIIIELNSLKLILKS